MTNFEAKVYVRNGNSRVPHTVRVQADSSYSAQQQLNGMYGANNVISIPVEVSGSSSYNSAPWMKDF